MKTVILNILKIFIYFINLIYSYNLHLKLISLKNIIYSIWIDMQFIKTEESNRFYGRLTLKGSQHIHIQGKCTFGYGCVLTAWNNYGTQILRPNISIGKDSHFGEYNHITAINSITIGNGVLTGRWVTITDNAHGKSDYSNLCIEPHKRDLYSKGPVIIEDNVWIGDKVSIMPNIKIGKSSIIAANSVVTKDVPPFSIVAGVPAKVIRTITKES